MKKRGIKRSFTSIGLLLSILLISLIGAVDLPARNTWNSTINGLQNSTDVGNEIALDNNSNVYVVGYSYWSSASTEDIYLGKFNSSGSNLWNVTINGPQNNNDQGQGVAVDSLGNIYVIGYSYWSSPTTFDLYLGKFNSSGSNLWNVTINGPQSNPFDYGTGVAVDNNSNIYVTGYTYWSTPGYNDIYLGKFNSSGSNLWNATINGPQNLNDYGQGVSVDNNSNIYVIGYSRWSSASTDDIYLGKFNSSGSNLWNATINGLQNSSDYGMGVAVDNNSNIYITGFSYWTSAIYDDIYLGKFNSSGSNLWNATINGPQNIEDRGYGVTVDNNSNIYVVGASFWSSGATYDIYLGKFNSSGSNLWNATINGPQNLNDYGQGVAVDFLGNIYVAGYSLWSSASTFDIYLGKFVQTTMNFTCSSCYECSTQIQNAYSGDIIQLNNSMNSSITCIDFQGKDNITLDCQSYSNFIKGPYNYNTIYGIYLNSSNGGSNNNIIRNCNVTGFSYGIYLYGSNNIVLTNITSNSNRNYGIGLFSSYSNNLTNLIISNNSNTGVYFYASSKNNLTNSIVQESSQYDLIFTYVQDCDNSITNITGSGGRAIEFYNYTATIQNKVLDALILCNVSNSVINNVTIQGSDTLNNSLLQLMWVSNTAFSNINSSYNYWGFDIFSSSNNTFTNITVNSNRYDGLYIRSNNNTFTNIIANSNRQYGILLEANSINITNSVIQENTVADITIGSNLYCNNYITNITGSGGRPIEFYNYSATIQNKVLSELFLCNANNFILNNVTIQGSDSLPNNYLYIWNVNNSILSNINSSNNYMGIFPKYFNNNNLTNITVNSNYHGIYIFNSNNNIFTNITANNIQYGISLVYNDNNNIFTNITANSNTQSGISISSSNNNTFSNCYIQNNSLYGLSFSNSGNNTFYNNYFNNTVNFYPSTLTNFFNTTKTLGTNIVGGANIGGNFWAHPNNTGFSQLSSTCADANSDGICDSAYNLDGLNYDYLPLMLLASQTAEGENETGGTPSGGGSLPPTTNQTFNPNIPIEILINNSQLDLVKIIIEVLETVSGASFSVTKVDIPNINEEIGIASGKLYQAFNITAKGITNDKIKNVTIDFKVNKTWLFTNNGTSSDIRLHRKANSSANWNILLTTLENQDDNYYYFSSFSPGFSTFVVFFGKYECQPGIARCYSKQSQLCLGNSTWLITEKCRFGCENGKCIKTPPQSTIIYTLMIAVVSVAIIITSYLLLTRIKKKRK